MSSLLVLLSSGSVFFLCSDSVLILKHLQGVVELSSVLARLQLSGVVKGRQTVGRMECERRGKFRRGCHMTEMELFLGCLVQ